MVFKNADGKVSEKEIAIKVVVRDKDAIERAGNSLRKFGTAAKMSAAMLASVLVLKVSSIALHDWGTTLSNALGKMPLVSESSVQGASVISDTVKMLFNASSVVGGVGSGLEMSALFVLSIYGSRAAVDYVLSRPKTTLTSAKRE